MSNQISIEHLNLLKSYLNQPDLDPNDWRYTYNKSNSQIYVVDRTGEYIIRVSMTPRRQNYYLNGNYLYWGYNQSVHRTVAEAFLPDWNPGLTVNHKDGSTFNNHANNLEMMTQAENDHHFLTSPVFEEKRKLWKQHLSESRKGRVHSEETKQKIAKAHRRENLSPEAIENYRRGNSNISEAQRKKMSEAAKGNKGCLNMIHIHKGDQRKMVQPEELQTYLSQGWTKGTGIVNRSSTGRIWITNGVDNKTIFPEDFETWEAKGWRKGMTR